MKKLLVVILVASLGMITYYTYRLHEFAVKASKAFAYTYAAVDCLIQESGQNETDVDIIFKGFKSRQAYADAANKEWPGTYDAKSPLIRREMYNDQIPECHVFYAQYRCWMLDPKDPKSLDGCGKHFGFTQEEIDRMKQDPKTVDTIMKEHWAKDKKETK